MIDSLVLTNFRNFAKLELSLSPNLNILVGSNGQGKTNILEAAHLLSTTRSFRTNRENELIRFGEKVAFLSGGGVEVVLESGEKTIRLGGKPVRAAEVLGQLRSVLFSPQDMDLLSGSPQGRRAFLDELISRIDHKYLLTLISYNKTLKQRNKLLWILRDRSGEVGELKTWDDLLVREGTAVTLRRLQVIDELKLELEAISKELLGSEVELEYLSKLDITKPAVEAIKQAFLDELINSHQNELRTATTLVGPHRDDFAVRLAGRNLGRFGSRGEQRAAILSLKLAEVSLNEKEMGSRPLLLLDDVLSELDVEHQQRLLQETNKQQTVLTATVLDLFPKDIIDSAKVVYVENGVIKDGL